MLAIERFVGPDEPILWAARPHAAALARPLALAVLAVVLGAAAVITLSRSDLPGAPIAALAAAAAAAIAVVRAGRAVFRWDRTVVAVTPLQVVLLALMLASMLGNKVLSPGTSCGCCRSLLSCWLDVRPFTR